MSNFTHLIGRPLQDLLDYSPQCSTPSRKSHARRELGRLQDGQMRGFSPFENPRDIAADLTIDIGNIDPVARQSTGIVDLQAAIDSYVADHNTDPKAF